MKKIFLTIITIALIAPSFAQDAAPEGDKVVNKNGVAILPEAGDIAVGIDMVPFMNYVGNMSNQTAGNTYNGQFLSNGSTFFAKYFLQKNMAVRGRLMISNSTNQYKQYVQDDAAVYADPNSPDMVVDVRKLVNHDYVIGAGIEMRRGKGRLQGFYGGELSLAFGADKNMYTYGNNYSELNQNPTTNDFFTGNVTANGRLLEDKGNSYFGVGLGAFLGVEYFIMPNIALGSELGWGINYTSFSQSTNTEEVWNGSSAEEITNLNSPGNKHFGYGLSNPTATLYLMFHF